MDSSISIDPILKQTLSLYSFPSPHIKESVDFTSSFHSSSSSESAQLLVSLLTQYREQFRFTLINYSKIGDILTAIDVYLPVLWQLLDSLDRQDPVRVDVPLRFVWKGSISILPEYHCYNQVIFELIMTIHSKGILLANFAREMIISDSSSVNTAAKFLREASSIMNFLSTNLIPRWQVVIDQLLKPPECSAEYCKFLSDYFAASSHQLVVAKALQGTSQLPSKLMTSLCLNVVRSMEYSIDFYTNHCPYDHARTDSQIGIHIAIQREFFYALVYYYQADDYFTKTETGISIALAAVAQTKLNEKTNKERTFNPATPGLPRLANQDGTLRAACVSLTEKIQALRHKAETDNRMIYFKAIPRDMSDLPELPQPTSLSLPTAPYEQPPTEVVLFTFDPTRQKTIFNSFTSFFSSSK